MSHILFIDDNPDFLDLLEQELEGEQYKVSTVLDSKEINLIEEIVKLKPDYLFIDIYLASSPIRNLCSALNSNPYTKRIPTCLMSFSDRSVIEQIAQDTGMQGCFCKPITAQKVREFIQRYPR